MDVIYLDFAKAFDKVPHQRLMSKVEAHGIGGRVSNWIKKVVKCKKTESLYKWSEFSMEACY